MNDNDRVRLGEVHELIGEMLTRDLPISSRYVRAFRKRPEGPIIPPQCIEVRRIPTDMHSVREVYLEHSVDAIQAPKLMLMGFKNTVRGERFLRCGDMDYDLASAALTYYIRGFLGGLPLYDAEWARLMMGDVCVVSLEWLASYEAEARMAGTYLGNVRLSSEKIAEREPELSAVAKLQVIVDPRDDRNKNVRSSYDLADLGAARVCVARFNQLRYLNNKMGPQPAFDHVTPPFKNKNGEWRYWGTTGTHLCLMEFASS